MIYIIKSGNSLNSVKVVIDKADLQDDNIAKIDEVTLIECFNEEDLFLKLLHMFPRESYWNIAAVIRSFGIEVTNDYLVKSYCSKCNRLKYYSGEDIYLILRKNKEFNRLDLVAICTKYEYNNYTDKELYTIVKIKKESLPFYLSLLLKRFTAKDFYFCFKNITGIKNIPTINFNSSEFYIVKNKSRIISYHSSHDLAIRTIRLTEELLEDNSQFFKLNIIKVEGYEELLNYIDNFKIQKTSDFEKYMIDFDWYFDYCSSKRYIDISNLDLKDDVFLIRNKNGETIIKNNEIEMYQYIKENKLYSEDIFFFKNADTDYNSVIKCFEIITEEFSYNETLSEYLKKLTYVDKIKVLNNITEAISSAYQEGDICYSLCKSTDYGTDLAFFDNEFAFHKHISSLDFGVTCLTHGKISVSTLRNILKPNTQTKNNKISRTDISFNVSNLFKKDSKSELLKSLKEMDVTLDVDAYLKSDKSACGVVVRDKNNEIITKISRKLDASTSVEAEIKGAIFAMDYITRTEPDLKNICIRYDCFSVADYLISAPTSEIGLKYQNFVRGLLEEYPEMNIYIKKVKGHSSDFFNDVADSLASNFFYK